ncbi:MAG: hypothetical protein M1480_10320 [Bacteroidetes bacterium]|nr:hypothetical protein [Bacteroidota bacterium]
MKLRIIKYRKLFANIFLATYILFIGLTIIHYHHIDIQNDNYKIVNTNGTESNLFDKLVDLTHECTVQQFASTIIDFNFAAVFNSFEDKSEQEFLKNEIIKLPSFTQYNNNPHRAPPTSCQFA